MSDIINQANLKDITKDILVHPEDDMDYLEKVMKEHDFSNADYYALAKAFNSIKGNPSLTEDKKRDLVFSSWKLIYRTKPPTIKEFLTTEYIGSVAESLFPEVRKVLTEFFDFSKPYRNAILAQSIGSGKAQSLDSLVYTPEGYTRMGDIKIGQEVCTPNGKTAKVKAIFPQEGKRELYELIFKDGRKVIADKDHLWKVYCSNWKKKGDIKATPNWSIKTTKEILDLGLYRKNNRKEPKWKIPLTKPVDHNEKSHYIKPYLLGCLIGDGSMIKGNAIRLTTIDSEILESCTNDLPEGYRLRPTINPIQYILVREGDLHYPTNDIKDELRQLSLFDKRSHEKFIPSEYLYDSVENRIDLLQGLMDTDGSVAIGGRRLQFSTTSLKLANDVQQLIRSLGGIASLSESDRRDRKEVNHNHINYTVSVHLPNSDFPVFRLNRKQDRLNEKFSRSTRNTTQNLAIIDIKRIEDNYAQCISLDDEDHLYLTDDYTVTHNSFATSLISLYEMYVLYHCRDVKKLLGQSSATNLAIVFISFTENKVKEVLAEILQNMMVSSPKFSRCQTLDQMNRKRKNDSSQIYWTTAGSTNFMTVGDLNVKVTSSLSRLLGLSTPLVTLSEMNFYSEANKSPEEALTVYQKAIDRVYSRLHGHPLGRTVLDSSPHDRTLPIENYVWNTIRKDPIKYNNYYMVTGSQWDMSSFKPDYPLFHEQGLSIPAYIGSGSKDPRIISPNELKDFHDDEIIHIPEDLRQQAETRLKETIRDYGGVPMGGDDVLIRNNIILDNLFNDSLRNIYLGIKAPSDVNPEGLIWEQVKNKFFIKSSKEKYEFYRYPNATRYVSVDQSISGDTTGIAMSHVEINNDGELVYVTDFTLAIPPNKKRINMDAIKLFIHDLRRYGNIKIGCISFDRFSSEPTIQYLKLHGFNVENLSVDITMSPYLNYVSLMEQNRVKMGRNIYMKNNLKSLRIVETPRAKKKKIDHLIGTIDSTNASTEWDISRIGYYAKDISDAVVASVELAVMYGSKSPRYIYSEESLTNRNVSKAMMKDKIKGMYSLV